MTWAALLAGAEAERAASLVDAIADELDRRATDDPSLGDGQAGIALFHGYRARAGHDDGEERAFAAAERALENVGDPPRPWLFHGMAGIGFALADLGELIGEATDVLDQLDGFVLRALAVDRLPACDLPSGAIGLGVYGFQRGSLAIVEGAVAHLRREAVRDAAGVSWRSYGSAAPDGYVNLGLAHGMCAAIAFLAGAHARGGAGDDAAVLVGDAVRWLRAHDRGTVPRYPMFDREIVSDYTGILDGWCYGDPSTALVLVRAGEVFDEPEWIDAGRALAHHVARRSAAELARLDIDTSLCHGAIGHAHILHRLGRRLGDDELLAAAASWYARALADDVIAKNAGSGLQTGLAGVGLALLAAISDVEPAWDRAMLLELGGAA